MVVVEPQPQANPPAVMYIYLFIYLFTRTHVAIDNINNNSCDHDDIHGTYSLCVTEEEVEVVGYNVISLYHHHHRLVVSTWIDSERVSYW